MRYDRLSKDFYRYEFACRCGCGFDTPDPALVYALQFIRDVIGKPVHVDSGCRCAKHNADEGGAEKSQHVTGKAADIRVNGMSSRDLYAVASTAPNLRAFGVSDQGGFVHVDTRDQPAKWCYRGGSQVAWYENQGENV